MMKQIIFLVLGIVVFTSADAQKEGKIYYLKNSGKLVSTKDSADYIVKITPSDKDKINHFLVEEYYKDGKIRFRGGADDDNLINRYPQTHGYYKPALNGTGISFYPNGNKLAQGHYKDGEWDGEQIQYYPNGSFYFSKSYTKDKKVSYIKCADSTGKVLCENGNGNWINFLDDNYKNYVAGKVTNGQEDGEWTGKRNDTVNIIYKYKNGELKSSASVDRAGERIYTMVEVVPTFPGGLNGFYKYLGENIRYPAIARKNNTQGLVIISFLVETDGTLTAVKAVRRIGSGCDEEGERVIKACPAWTPGLVDGKPVRVLYSVPIHFALTK